MNPHESPEPSMKVPPKRKGNAKSFPLMTSWQLPSMKVPPKRKGNVLPALGQIAEGSLNESPSEKEGKYPRPHTSLGSLLSPQ